MKKLFLLLLLGVSVPVAAEIVSKVSFNPSRLGKYNYLKISRDANFQGGLKAKEALNVSTKGTNYPITMKWEGHNAAEKYYDVTFVTTNGSTATVNMPNTTFLYQDQLTDTTVNYNCTNPTAPGDLLPTIKINGGTLNFATNNDSYVAELNGGDESTGDESTTAPLQFYTKKLTEDTLNITGKSKKDDGIGLTNKEGTSRNVESTLGFHLAGVDIPYPTGDYVKKTGSVSLNTTDAALCWVPRCTTAGKVAFVLGLVNGACPPTTGTVSCSGNTGDGSDGEEPASSYAWQHTGAYGSGECLLPVGNPNTIYCCPGGTGCGAEPDSEKSNWYPCNESNEGKTCINCYGNNSQEDWICTKIN